MIKKILIANRGEIACRIIRTCKKLGIKSVAIYSIPDENSLFVREATEAYSLFGVTAQDTYLNIDKIIKIALQAKVDAIHPGYGFLSENAQFAHQVIVNGIAFIGPDSEAIAAMGLKSEAKRMMKNANVSVLPSYSLENLDDIDYPVLIKAAAGGGGKGMRIVNNQDDLLPAIAAAKREALKYFANDEIIIEKYLKNPRHIEVQILFDHHGNGVYLFERDCSLQRRYQKIIEEAPAPNINANLRRQLGEQAVMAGQAVNYKNAGTIEFLLEDDHFYFMEMNTRLQVEHPITELITNLDLVELQIKIANGEHLPFKQDDLKINGHAIEARIYAEDVYHDFLPATGKIRFLEFNQDNKVRIDSGIQQSDNISIYYDPMLAKIIAHGYSREQAIDNLVNSLQNTYLVGVDNNLSFVLSCLLNNKFKSGDVSTNFINQNLGELLNYGNNLSEFVMINSWVAAAIYYNFVNGSDVNDPWSKYHNWRNIQAEKTSFKLCSLLNKKEISNEVTIECLNHHLNNQKIILSLNNHESKLCSYLCSDIKILNLNNSVDLHFVITSLDDMSPIQGIKVSKKLILLDNCVYLFHDGLQYIFSENSLISYDLIHADKGALTAPMPGTIIAINVDNGTRVKAGQPLMILEAMKMEHTIFSPVDGVVANVNFKCGEQVALGAELLLME